jgi:hypothetical protein
VRTLQMRAIGGLKPQEILAARILDLLMISAAKLPLRQALIRL